MALDRLRRDASGARDRSEDRLAAHQRRGGARVQRADAALQPVRRRRPRQGQPAGAGADRETRARAEPHLQPARPDPARRATSPRCGMRSKDRRCAACDRAASSTSTTCSKARSRKRVMLLVDEMPAEERIRKGNVIYRTRTRDVEDTLAQLLHDEDQSIASAAVLLVEERGLWSLADDLEHVLAHRDVRDQHVFEAASWALAANRVKAERRKQLWQEPLPAVELADRLRKVPLFDFTHVDELFRLARLGRQVRYETGPHGVRARRAASRRSSSCSTAASPSPGRSATSDVAAPAALGFEELLEGSPMASTITAAERAITLSLTADEFLALLSENVELAEGIFRMLIATHDLATGHTLHPRQPAAPEHRRTGARAICGRSIACCCCNRARCSRTPRRRSCGGCRRLPAKPRSLPGTEALPKGSDAAILIVLSGSLKVERRRRGRHRDRRRRDRHVRNAGRIARSARRSPPTPKRRLLRIDRGGAVRAARRSHRSASGHILDAACAARAGRSRTPSRRPDGCARRRVPPCRSTIAFTIDSPSPDPPACDRD